MKRTPYLVAGGNKDNNVRAIMGSGGGGVDT